MEQSKLVISESQEYFNTPTTVPKQQLVHRITYHLKSARKNPITKSPIFGV